MESLEKAFNEGHTYSEYRNLIDGLFEKGKSTGPIQNEDMLHYSEMNIARMSRWDKHLKLEEYVIKQMKSIGQKQYWILISEGWCGDAAHSVPVIAAMSSLNEHIHLRIILRDEHLDIMDQYLTNGGRSIPKLIMLNEKFEELNTWGPRPKLAFDLVTEATSSDIPLAEIKMKLQLWYSKDKGNSIQQEIAALVIP